MKKRGTVALLLALLTVVSVAGCASGNVESETTPAATQPEAVVTTGPETTEPSRENYPDGIPDSLKFSGEKFRILYFDKNNYRDDFVAEGITGDLVPDAVYNRNMNVMERFGMELELIAAPSTDTKSYCSYVDTQVSAGEYSWDLISAYQAYTVPLAMKGVLADVSDAEYLDFSQPWWEFDYMKELLIGSGDRIYFMQGDIALFMLGSMGSVYYNKRLLGDIDQSFDVYATVSGGEWTLERFSELASIAYSDTNGNQIMDDGDVFGFGATTVKSTEHFMYDAGVRSNTRDADGYPVYTFGDDRSVEFIEKLYNLYYNNPGAMIYTADSGISQMEKDFKSGHMLLLPGWLYMAKGICGDCVDDYGIIPYPKYDAEQPEYLTLVHDGTTIYCIPSTCDRLSMVSAVTEAFAAESWRKVTPAYFEVALKNRYASDLRSAEMIDLIRAGITTDYFYANNYCFSGTPGLLCRTAMKGKLSSISSQIRAAQRSTEKTLKTLIEEYKALTGAQ